MANAVLLLSVVVAIVLLCLFAVALKNSKNQEEVWRKLGDGEPAKRVATGISTSQTGDSATAPEKVVFKQSQLVAWEDSNYCWVVLCKNHWFHRRRSLFHGHRIPLGETDAVAPRPAIHGRFSVRCDECHEEYRYIPSDLVRYPQALPDSFVAHPLFQARD